MKELLRKLFLLSLMAVMAFSMVSCGSSDDPVDPEEDDEEIERPRGNYPEWFLDPPNASDTLYAIGIAEKQTLQLALDTATARARNEIARIVKVKVSTMTKDFLEEAGVTGESVSTEFTQVVSKQVSDNTLTGTMRDKTFVDDSDPERSTVFVMVRLSLADMSGAIEEVMKNNAAAYARLQANKGFEDLENELKKLDSDDYSDKPIIVDYD